MQAFLQDEVLHSAMLQMDEGLRLRADPASPRTPSTLGACAQHFGACVGGFSKYAVCVGTLSKTTLHRILQESEPLAFDADTEAESEAESEGDADI